LLISSETDIPGGELPPGFNEIYRSKLQGINPKRLNIVCKSKSNGCSLSRKVLLWRKNVSFAEKHAARVKEIEITIACNE
jgi:hypothetical protein